VTDTSGVPEALALVAAWGVAAVGAGWCADASATAEAPPGELPRAKAAAARPANAAGAAANGSMRLIGELAEFAGLPKGLLPAQVALTRKAACTVHWLCTTTGSLRSA